VQGRHTGTTDVALNDEGRREAMRLAPALAGRAFALVLTSPRQRARETCALAGFGGVEQIDDDLREWDYGEYEGRTTSEIRDTLADPNWSVWTTTTGLAESVEAVGARAERVLARCRPLLQRGDDVVLVAHAHLLRILTATWLRMPPRGGQSLVLAPAGTGLLGYERETPALLRWNS